MEKSSTKTAEERARAIVDDLLARGIPVGPSWTECISGLIAGALREHGADVRADEREACAKLAENPNTISSFDGYGIGEEIADAIRARGAT